MAHNGLAITKEDLNKGGSTTSGGHAALRNPVNQYIAAALSGVSQRVFVDVNTHYIIHDVGAKYVAQANTLVKALGTIHTW